MVNAGTGFGWYEKLRLKPVRWATYWQYVRRCYSSTLVSVLTYACGSCSKKTSFAISLISEIASQMLCKSVQNQACLTLPSCCQYNFLRNCLQDRNQLGIFANRNIIGKIKIFLYNNNTIYNLLVIRRYR